MTWTATSGQNTLISDGGNLTNVVLNNGTTTVRLVDVPNDGTAASLAAGVKARIAARDATSGVRQFVAVGTVLDMTTPVAPAPTQADTDRANWSAAYTKVQRLQRGLSAGLSVVTQQNVTDAQTALNALAYDPSYEAML